MLGVQFNATLASISSALEGAPRALKKYSYFEITEDRRMMSPSTAFVSISRRGQRNGLNMVGSVVLYISIRWGGIALSKKGKIAGVSHEALDQNRA